jgi:pimeloyl-ACP methyl ester carboxylesterase
VLLFFAQQGYFAVAPDLPGHGKSLLKDFHPIESVYGFDEILWALTRKLAMDLRLVVGSSLGGDITLDLAAPHGGSIAAAVACEGAVPTPTFPPAVIELGLLASGPISPGSPAPTCSSGGRRTILSPMSWSRRPQMESPTPVLGLWKGSGITRMWKPRILTSLLKSS